MVQCPELSVFQREIKILFNLLFKGHLSIGYAATCHIYTGEELVAPLLPRKNARVDNQTRQIPSILSRLPTVDVTGKQSHEKQQFLSLQIPSKNLRAWFEHEGIRMSDSATQLFFQSHGGNRDFTSLKMLYDGLCCNPEKKTKSEDVESLKNEARNVYENLLLWSRCVNGSSKEELQQLPTIEFANYLFSEMNSIVRPETRDVYQNMTKPFSHYWINSSHNTYLVGNQYSSDASPESYVSALLYGCRCVESVIFLNAVDCWNGDTEPVITHGHTFTSKAKFRSVILAVKEYAFEVTDLAIFYTILNSQLIVFVNTLLASSLSAFVDQLLSAPTDNDETKLPSPHDLRGKVILKHKKLKLVQGELVQDDSDDKDDDKSSVNGMLYMETPKESGVGWTPFYCSINSEGKLLFLPDTKSKGSDGLSASVALPASDPAAAQMYPALAHLYSQPPMSTEGLGPDLQGQLWYHGDLTSEEATAWLEHFSFLKNGVFLVRRSRQHPNHGVISYLLDGEVREVLVEYLPQSPGYIIRQRSLRSPIVYPTMGELIADAKINDRLMNAKKQYVRLTEPVPPRHSIQPWYHENLDRAEAEQLLQEANIRGSFLVRLRNQPLEIQQEKASDTVKYVLSYVAESFSYNIYDKEFNSLYDLVDFYHRGHDHGRVPLLYPVNRETAKLIHQ
ncbi:hypothetical protein Ciccas_002218, partial [Cichlidogyrus casuarinus]